MHTNRSAALYRAARLAIANIGTATTIAPIAKIQMSCSFGFFHLS